MYFRSSAVAALAAATVFAACSDSPTVARASDSTMLTPSAGSEQPLVLARTGAGPEPSRAAGAATVLQPTTRAAAASGVEVFGRAPAAATAPTSPYVMWENTTTGERRLLAMTGPAYAGTLSMLGVVPKEWTVAASGDFSCDGTADMLWRNNVTGEIVIWNMTGTAYSGTSSYLGVVPTAWSIAGAGDFTADGKPDIVWQNRTTGERSIWIMDCARYASQAYLGSASGEWDIAAVADLTGDNRPDLVWQNTATGERRIWQMNGTTPSAQQYLLGVVPAPWDIAGAADYTGDNRPDFLWQNPATGARVIWQMNGPAYSGTSYDLGVVPTTWRMAGSLPLGATTTPPTTPPPSTATVDTIFYDGFESGSLSKWEDGVDPSKHTIVTNSAYAVGGSRALKVSMPAGGDGGWLTHWFMPGYDSAYVRIYARWENDFNGGDKLLALRGSRLDDKWSAYGKAGVCPSGTDFFGATLTLSSTYNPGPMHFYNYYPGMPSSSGCYGDESGSYTHDTQGMSKGVYHKIEFWLKLNTINNADAFEQFWIDGVLWGTKQGFRYRTTSDLHINSVELTLNATASSTPRTMYIDEVLVTKQKPQ